MLDVPRDMRVGARGAKGGGYTDDQGIAAGDLLCEVDLVTGRILCEHFEIGERISDLDTARDGRVEGPTRCRAHN